MSTAAVEDACVLDLPGSIAASTRQQQLCVKQEEV